MSELFELSGDALRGYSENPQPVMLFEPAPVQVKLGRVRSSRASRAPRLAMQDIDPLALANLPDAVDYTTKAMASISRMYLNDQMGCCVISDRFHVAGVLTGNDLGTPVLGTDQEVYDAYVKLKAGPGDSGCIPTDVLDYMRDYGITIGGKIHKIDGYATIDHRSKDLVRFSTYRFGSVTLGVNLPKDWLSSSVWDVSNSQIVGGHDIPIVGFNTRGVLVSSWGRVFLITYAALASQAYVEEAHAVLSPDWYNDDKTDPNKIPFTRLQGELATVARGTIPPLDPPTPVPPLPPSPNEGWTVTLKGTGAKPSVLVQ